MEEKLEKMLNTYTVTKDCIYKVEHYSVRDNGAIMRHPREGKRIRKNDNVWTFGTKDEKTGYMKFGKERVHRIVAYAFHGEPPASDYVVDHRDTNRCNNRPENLKWLTKLENALNNPFTRRKIEIICGSIEAFLENPSLIQNYSRENPNLQWMRTVSSEEAKAAFENLQNWIRSEPIRPLVGNEGIGEWIFNSKNSRKYKKEVQSKPKYDSQRNNDEIYDDGYELESDYTYQSSHNFASPAPYSIEKTESSNIKESLTPNAMQKYWKTPTEFPLCPSTWGDEPLKAYMKNLKIGDIVTNNINTTHVIDDWALCNNDTLLMIRTHAEEGIKKFSTLSITFENGKFIHSSETFFQEDSAEKALTLAQGKEWLGGDTFDDYVS